MDDRGWFTGENGQLLFWIPPYLRPRFPHPPTRLVIPSSPELDVSQMVHGDRWHEVYVGNNVEVL